MNLFKIAENLQQALVDAGVRFTLDGYPIIPEEMILQDYPRLSIVTLVKIRKRQF